MTKGDWMDLRTHKANISDDIMNIASGDRMNINLGAPYEEKLRNIIQRGYAGNQTEALRQAITRYEQDLEDEEAQKLAMACDGAFEKMRREGRTKTYTLEEVMRKYKV